MVIGGRRDVLQLALGTALASTLLSTAARAGSARQSIEPPSGPMLYSRRLTRSLSGGAALSVVRSFEIRFRRSLAGFTVNGAQISARVEAPASLAGIARIEEERVENGIFPLDLDLAGMILGGAAPQDGPMLDRALAMAKADLGSQHLLPDDRASLSAFLTTVHEAGSAMLSRLPTDLFAPSTAPRAERRVIDVEGGQGQITSRFSARIDPLTGLMSQASREIVTSMAGTSRITREDWTLQPA